MSQNHHERTRRLFEEAAALSGDDRVALLSAARSQDPEIVADVESLLDYHDRADAILDRSPVLSGSAPLPSRSANGDLEDGQTIELPAILGNYTLLRVIGEGGMGVVYEAMQASPHRSVAVKLIRPEVLSPSIIRRFEHEAEALGMIDHPCIARVYEAGRAEVKGADGLEGAVRAFIAMELVLGAPLTEYARAAGLTMKQRIELLAEVCDAVEAAHRRGIIHRDLKPANILVGEDGRPRILDFGVARLGSANHGGTIMTRSGQIMGTLAYMSPEQAVGDPARMDSRSDVYSLGAILYELLCGRVPIDVSNMQVHAALAAIQSVEPRVPREVRQELGRDAEAILLRSLEKDPARRYQHASALAADLRSMLRSEPVTAVAPTLFYQVSRFCRRNRELTAAAAVVAATLVVAIIATGSALVREREARADAVEHALQADAARDEALANAAIARRNLERNEAVTAFLRTLLGGIRAEVARGRDTTLLRSILESSERSLVMLDDQPVAKADSHTLLGDIFRDIGEYERSESHYLRSLELYHEHLGEDHRAAAVSMHNLGALYRGSMGRLDEAEPLLRRAVEIFVELAGPDDTDSRRARNSLALMYLDSAKYAKAEPLLHDLRASDERVFGPTHIATQRAMHNHAGVLSMLGRVHEAYELATRTHEIRSMELGEDHPNTIVSMLLVGSLLRTLGRPEEALPLVKKGVEFCMQQAGEAHQRTVNARTHLVVTLRDLGRHEDAEAEAEATLEVARNALGETHIDTLQVRMLALELRVLRGRCEGALAEASEIIDIFSNLGDRFALWQSVAQMGHGLGLACEGDAEGAEAALRLAYEALEGQVTRSHRFTQRTAELLAWLLTEWDRPAEAAQWLQRASVAP